MLYLLILITLVLAIIGWFKSTQPSKRVSWGVLGLLVLGAIAQGFMGWNESQESTRLQTTLDTLSRQNDSLLIQNGQLYGSNQDLLERIEGYQEQLEGYEYSVKTVKNYAYVARLDIYGYISTGRSNVGLSSGISGFMDSVYTKKKHEIECNCTARSISKLRLVVRAEPSYPFSYYGLAYCFRLQRDSLWIQNANHAKTILERTVEIVGHNYYHELALANVNKWLTDAGL